MSNLTQLEGRKLTTAINTINTSNCPVFVQQVLVSIAFSALHGNTDPLNKVNYKDWNGLQRKWLLDNVIKPCTTKNKDTKKYENDTQKRMAHITPIYGEMSGVTFEAVAENMPFWKPETEKTVVKFDAIKRAKNLIKSAEKALEDGNIEGDAELVQTLIDALKPFNV